MRGKLTKKHLFLFGAFLFLFPSFVFAEEQIHSFDVDIEVFEDSSIQVLETIEYSFGDVQRRGIFRDIPYKYDTSIGKRKVVIDVVSVTRNGLEEPFKVTTSGDNVRIRIGDPDIYIENRHTYRITYTVRGAMNQFDGFDELYWNAIGHNWNVPIRSASVHVFGIDAIEQTSCFFGFYASNAECLLVPDTENGLSVQVQDLESGEGITVAVAYTKGVVSFPTTTEKIWWWLTANPFVFIPIFVFLYMWKLWDRKGRDAKGRGTIIPEYTPPAALNPMFLGSIVDGRLDSRDITAGIIYLAEQDLLLIIKTEEKKFLIDKTDYKFIWRGEYAELPEKDKLVVKLLFGEHVVKGEEVTLEELQKDTGLHKRRKNLQKYIDEELQRAGYYANKPQATQQKWLAIGIVLFFFIFGLFGLHPVLGASALVSAVIIIVFGALMPKRTRVGAEMKEHILGFKEFLNVTERERLDFHNAPERTPKEFMEFLPFAIALGVEKKWAQQFEGIVIEQPKWYRGGSTDGLTAAAFVSDISGFSTSVASGVTAAQGGSGTSGGGFSGGGAGGGGGGSW